MKRSIITLMAAIAVTGAAAQNPLLEQSDAPHGTPRFTQIKLEHYMPAFEAALEDARRGVEAIYTDPEPATFENTIVALERNGALLNSVAGIFYPLNNSLTSDDMEEIANALQPLLTAYSNDVSLNPALFERVKQVYEQRNGLELDTEQRMLLENTYKGFSRSGAALSEEDKVRYRAISEELGALSLRFGQNVLAEINSFSYNIPASDAHKVDYMPEFVREGMAAEARERGQQGWTVTLQQPSLIPFMTYSRERDIKEQLWRANNSLSYNDSETSNKDIVLRMSELRRQLAELLGYETYADFVLEERMARSRETVDNFLNDLLDRTIDWAREEVAEVAEYAREQDGIEELMPWDFGYYSERLKNERYEFNEEEIKPYFQLENAEKGTFELASKLYGIEFRENPQIEVYHPDVKAYEVFDKDGRFLSVLYMDYFPRASKRGGAWMTNFREMYTAEDGTEVRPFVTLNFNFTKPTEETPSLLTFSELTILLHEFGHGLHGMLAQGRYESLTGTSVYRDFVELPSQVMENWATEKEFLDLWAVHYQTGERIPEELVAKIKRSENYLAAYANVRQISFGMNDMAWHTITSPVEMDPGQFEKLATAKTQLLPVVDGTCMATAFSHIFAGGYAAGYYGYKWAEVLDTDAFSVFKERGLFDRETAQSFRDNILSRGGSEHPMTLYVNFRGQEPQTEALVRRIAGDRMDL